jgi:hypothetical protein
MIRPQPNRTAVSTGAAEVIRQGVPVHQLAHAGNGDIGPAQAFEVGDRHRAGGVLLVGARRRPAR